MLLNYPRKELIIGGWSIQRSIWWSIQWSIRPFSYLPPSLTKGQPLQSENYITALCASFAGRAMLGRKEGGGVEAVGWSDLALFSIFENLHISVDQVYF